MGMTFGKNWHVVTYDIRCPRRLRRVHRSVREDCLAVQQSVFLFNGSADQRDALLEKLAGLIEPVDDVRVYPTPHPARLWMSARLNESGQVPDESLLLTDRGALGQVMRRVGGLFRRAG